VPGAPTSNADSSRISAICLPVRLGNACASSAAAPETCGVEKLVPESTYTYPWLSVYICPSSYAQQIRLPRAVRKCAPWLPARLLKLDMSPSASTEPTMSTPPLPAWSSRVANDSGCASPSLPAAMTTSDPRSTASRTAFCSAVLAPCPPSEMLITLAPLPAAKVTAAAMSLSEKLQSAALLVGVALEHEPTESVRSAMTVAP
jgi:hypothetical protein